MPEKSIKTSAAQISNSMPYIGFGKSVTNSVVFGTTYGTPGNKSVRWDYTITEVSTSGAETDWTDTFKSKELITIKSGKVTVSSKVKEEWLDIGGEFYLTLYAYAQDGTAASASKTFLLIRPCTKLRMIENTRFIAVKNVYSMLCFESDQWHAFFDNKQSGFVVTSSNPKVCCVGQWYYDHNQAILPCSHDTDSNLNTYDLYLYTGSTKGKATITIKATDGSNKSCKFTVTVR